MRLDFAALSDPIQKNVGTRGTLGTSSIHTALIRPRLPGNAGDTWGQTLAHVIEGQDERPDLSPVSPKCPQPWGHGKPSIHAVSPVSPVSPRINTRTRLTAKPLRCPPMSPVSPVSPRINTRTRLTPAFEERAAIMEFDGGLSRAEAELLAAESLGVGA